MSGKRDAAKAALANVERLHDSFHEPILAQLDKAGLLDNPNGGAVHARATSTSSRRLTKLRSAMQAAADCPENAELVRQLRAQGRRLGLDMPLDRPLSIAEVDQVFAGKSVDARLAWKISAAQLGILE